MKMFKFETIVYVLMTVLIIPLGNAENNNPASQNSAAIDSRASCSQFLRELEDPEVRARKIDAAKSIYGEGLSDQELLKRLKSDVCSSSSGGSCDTVEKDFQAAKSSFSEACGTLQIPSGGAEGAIACSYNKQRCQCLNKNFNDDDGRLNCEAIRGEGARSGSRATAKGLIDLNQAESQMKYCPEKNPDDAERYEKQLADSQKRVAELKKKLPELNNKASEAEDKIADKENQAYNKAAEAQKQLGNELREIRQKQGNEEQQAVNEMAQIRDKMGEVEDQIRKLEIEKITAQTKMEDTKTQLDLSCHQQASEMVATEQANKMGQIKKGIPQGDFNSMMNQVGVSSRTAWEKVADTYYRRCLKSKRIVEGKASAQKAYNNALTAIDASIVSQKDSLKRLKQNLNQISSPRACGQAQIKANGMTGESRMCRTLRDAREDMQQAYRNAQQQKDQAMREIQTAKQQAAKKQSSSMMESAQLQQEINDEQRRMENLEAFLDLKRKYGAGGGTKKAAEELHSSFAKLESSANTYIACCSSGTLSNCPNRTIAEDFVRSLGREAIQGGGSSSSRSSGSQTSSPDSRSSNPGPGDGQAGH